LVTEANWQVWQAADFSPFLDVAFEAFGPDRLMFGSDWPVASLSATYEKAFELVRNYAVQHGAGTEAKLFGLNATSFYDL
jgi:L-fuconolactonase